MHYLLDSTVLIDHANGDRPATELLQRLFGEGHQLFTCDVVTCEVLSRGTDADLRHLRSLLEALEYVSTSPDAARLAGDARHRGHRVGQKRSLADALIGGVARSISATVVSRNRPDFERQGIPVLSY